MPPSPFPKDLKTLTGLRFWAALWVVLFHFRGYAGVEAIQTSALTKGYLGVDLFFILSGFVLAHVYGQSLADGTYRHLPFIKKRIARVYPMHIVMLAFFFVVALAAPAIGFTLAYPDKYDFAELPKHVLMVHAWIGRGEEFNYPSWSISAEFFAYICFPAVMLLARWPRLMMAAGLVAVFGWYFGAVLVTGRHSTGLVDWHIMRIMPEFLLGAGMRMAMAHMRIPLLTNKHATLAMAVVVVALAAINAPDWAMLAGLIGLIAAAAERSRDGHEGVLESKTGLYLGEISYALYMVHVAVAMVYFNITDRLVGRSEHVTVFSVAIVLGGILVAVACAAVAERFIERPGRKFITGLGRPQRVRAQPAD